MKYFKLQLVLLVALCTICFSSCNKDDDSNNNGGNDSRVVKYELTGTYSGTLLIGYTNAEGVSQILNDVELPWSIEVVMTGEGARSIGFTAGSEVGGFGQPNETMRGKIFVGGAERENAPVNSTSIGYISLSVSSTIQ